MKSPVSYFTVVLQVWTTLIHTHRRTDVYLIGAFRTGSTNVIDVHRGQSNHTLVLNLAQMIPIPARTPIKDP